MSDSGDGARASFEPHRGRDPTGRHLVIKPGRRRPADGSRAGPSDLLNATTGSQRPAAALPGGNRTGATTVTGMAEEPECGIATSLWRRPSPCSRAR